MRKFFKILFSTIFILFAVLIVGVFVFIKTFDLNSYKAFEYFQANQFFLPEQSGKAELFEQATARLFQPEKFL